MLKQGIKTKEELQNVAVELKNDLMQMLNIYESYDVNIEDGETDVKVKVTSTASWRGITGCVLRDIIAVIDIYGMQYRNVRFCICSEPFMEGNYVKSYPVVEVTIEMENN
jgi:hypothetical protein